MLFFTCLRARTFSKFHLNQGIRAGISSFSLIAEQAKLDLIPQNHAQVNARKRREIARNFISDTVTAPSQEMYAYAINATLGDDGYCEPSTATLESHVARLLGKEAGLFLPSGTSSNEIALRTHLKQPPYSILCDKRSHINLYEAGGPALNIGASLIPVAPSNGHHLTLRDIKDNIVTGTDIFDATTELVSLENTLDGTIIPQDEVVAISDFVRPKGIKMHLDGARLWHVVAETDLPLKTLCAPFDSVAVCFSKGLGAPVGSCLVGSKEFIRKARRFRIVFGVNMRQTGFLAACAAYALTHNFSGLKRVHALARRLEAGLEKLGVRILTGAETCMVFYDPSPLGISYDEITERARSLPQPFYLTDARLVVHFQTSEAAVDDFLGLLERLSEEKKSSYGDQEALSSRQCNKM